MEPGPDGKIPHEDLSTTEKQAFSLVQERDGIYQSQLWKEMDISSRTGSRVAQSLADMGLIKRAEKTHEGNKTYELDVAVPDRILAEGQQAESGRNLEGLSDLARLVLKTLEKRGELPIRRINREVDATQEEVNEAMRELIDREVISVGREKLYGRQTDIVSLSED